MFFAKSKLSIRRTLHDAIMDRWDGRKDSKPATLHRLDPDAPKNLRLDCAEPSAPSDVRTSASLQTIDEEQPARSMFERSLLDKPLPEIPLPEPPICELPADNQIESAISFNEGSGISAGELDGVGIVEDHASEHVLDVRTSYQPDMEAWSTITSSSVDVDVADSDGTHVPAQDPVRVVEFLDDSLGDRTVLVLNSNFSQKLLHVLKAQRDVEKTKTSAELKHLAINELRHKLKIQIARHERRLEELHQNMESGGSSDDVSNAPGQQVSTLHVKLTTWRHLFSDAGFESQSSGSDHAVDNDIKEAIAFHEKQVTRLRQLLEETSTSRSNAATILTKQILRLQALQAEVNGDFDQAFVGADLLEAHDNQQPSSIKEPEASSKFEGLCDYFGITWQNGEAESERYMHYIAKRRCRFEHCPLSQCLVADDCHA